MKERGRGGGTAAPAVPAQLKPKDIKEICSYLESLPLPTVLHCVNIWCLINASGQMGMLMPVSWLEGKALADG